MDKTYKEALVKYIKVNSFKSNSIRHKRTLNKIHRTYPYIDDDILKVSRFKRWVGCYYSIGYIIDVLLYNEKKLDINKLKYKNNIPIKYKKYIDKSIPKHRLMEYR